MVPVTVSAYPYKKVHKEYSHGRCYIKVNGLDSLLAMPTENVAGLTLDDVGEDAMRAILDKHYPVKKPNRKEG